MAELHSGFEATANIDLGTHKVVNVGTPSASTDAATKGYVDTAISTLDDVLAYADLISFPVSGTTNTIYVANDTGYLYRWSGTAYVQVGGGAALVSDVFGRTGSVVAGSGDYTAAQITNTPAGAISATTVQAAINELDTEKAPLNSPTFITPALGTPTSATLTNATGLPISSGVSGLGTGVATALATPSSANIKAAVTDETGSGALVFANSPALITPTGIVKGDVGLGNVDNTSDANKPVSTAQAAANALALAKASNLSDLASATTARTNLGVLGYVLQLGANMNTTVAASTTYYFGAHSSIQFSGTSGTAKTYVPKAGTVTTAQIHFHFSGTQSITNSLTSTLSLRLNNTSDTALSTAVTNTATTFYATATGLSVAITNTDYLELKWVTPAWATPPTNVRVMVALYIE